MKKFVLAAMAAGSLTPVAIADVLDSVRFGVMDHNAELFGSKNANKEDDYNISLEARFKQWDIIGETWSPYPYVMASVNTAGDTSYAAVGVEWDFEFADGWHFQPGIGYTLHTGEVASEGATPEERAVFDSQHVLFGSEDLFRVSFAVAKDLNDDWGVQLLWDHLSHGQILGSGRNQGIDDVGIRVVRSF